MKEWGDGKTIVRTEEEATKVWKEVKKREKKSKDVRRQGGLPSINTLANKKRAGNSNDSPILRFLIPVVISSGIGFVIGYVVKKK